MVLMLSSASNAIKRSQVARVARWRYRTPLPSPEQVPGVGAQVAGVVGCHRDAGVHVAGAASGCAVVRGAGYAALSSAANAAAIACCWAAFAAGIGARGRPAEQSCTLCAYFTQAGRLSPLMALLVVPRVDQFQAARFEVSDVSRRELASMSASYRGDLAVNDTHRTSEAAPQSKSSTRSANPPDTNRSNRC